MATRITIFPPYFHLCEKGVDLGVMCLIIFMSIMILKRAMLQFVKNG